MAAAGAGLVLALLIGLGVPVGVYALSKRERIGDDAAGDGTGVERSAAERWARRDDDTERNDDRDRR